jgi:hypothetical protein
LARDTARAVAHASQALDKLGIRGPHLSMVRWLSCRVPEALADYRSRPDRVWNRIPDDVCGQIIDMALESAELSPPEMAVRVSLKQANEQDKFLAQRDDLLRRARQMESGLHINEWPTAPAVSPKMNANRACLICERKHCVIPVILMCR